MENIVYILGAGFSAPLGLPVVSNFYQKSRDMYDRAPVKYGHFRRVFDTIKPLANGKHYYNIDGFNIEEILSILEMRKFLAGGRLQKEFKQYIIDVIRHYTPGQEKWSGSTDVNLAALLFGMNQNLHSYSAFMCNLFQLRVDKIDSVGKTIPTFVRANSRDDRRYGIISLNYDYVLEGVTDFMRSNVFLTKPVLDFSKDGVDEGLPLGKLHGCVTGDIIPPTWNKGSDKGILEAWKLAYKLLKDATQIRILGYSMPVADSYIRYLLKAAAIDGERLHKIDVICMDSDGEVRDRFRELITFKNFRFKNGDLRGMLHRLVGPPENMNAKHLLSDPKHSSMSFEYLEEFHDIFMNAG